MRKLRNRKPACGCGPKPKGNMSQIADYHAKQVAFHDRQDVAVEGITKDVADQAALIKQLQENPGPITPEDQALLDQLQARNEAVTAKLEALDALTPPTPPPA